MLELVYVGSGVCWNCCMLGMLYVGTGVCWDWCMLELMYVGTGVCWNLCMTLSGLMYVEREVGCGYVKYNMLWTRVCVCVCVRFFLCVCLSV